MVAVPASQYHDLDDTLSPTATMPWLEGTQEDILVHTPRTAPLVTHAACTSESRAGCQASECPGLEGKRGAGASTWAANGSSARRIGCVVAANETVSSLSEAEDAKCWARLHEQLQDLHRNVQEFKDRSNVTPVPTRFISLPGGRSTVTGAPSGVQLECPVLTSSTFQTASRFMKVASHVGEPLNAPGKLDRQPSPRPPLLSARETGGGWMQTAASSHEPRMNVRPLNGLLLMEASSTVSTASQPEYARNDGRSVATTTSSSWRVTSPRSMPPQVSHRPLVPSSPRMLTARETTPAQLRLKPPSPVSVTLTNAGAFSTTQLHAGTSAAVTPGSPHRSHGPLVRLSQVPMQLTVSGTQSPPRRTLATSRATSPTKVVLAVPRTHSPVRTSVTASRLQRQSLTGLGQQLGAHVGSQFRYMHPG